MKLTSMVIGVGQNDGNRRKLDNMKKQPMMKIKDKQLQLNLPVTWIPISWFKPEEKPAPVTKVTHPISTGPVIKTSEHNDGPRCSLEQVQYYRKNKDRILPPEVMRSVRKHRDVLHGGRSVNMLLPKKYYRETKDFDIYSKLPKTRADEIENYIDKRCGCDMAHVNSMIVPNVSATEDELMSADIHRVITRIESDAEVDYMTLPPKLPIRYHRGIRHEKLTEALRKAKKGLMQPMRMAKASKDVRRISEYLESRGKLK